MVDAASIDNSLLIYLVEKHPVLWDRTMELYKNRIATHATWKQVLKSLYPEYMAWNDETRKENVKLIKQRWTHIRDNYYRSYRKQIQRNANARPTKPYLYSKRLAFLNKILQGNEVENFGVDIKTGPHEINSESIDISENSLDTNDIGTMNSTLENMPDLEENRTDDYDANDPFSNQKPSETNRHLLFFKGILPSLNDFDDYETIDFQMGVLKLVKKFKSSRKGQQFPFRSFKIKFEDESNSPGYSSDQ